MKTYLLVLWIGLLSTGSLVAQKTNHQKDTMINCKLLRMANYLFIIPDSNFLQKDTIDVLDNGSMSDNCITGINSEFNQKEYNVYTSDYMAREPYYDAVKKDSVIAWLDLRLFVFDACIKYNNLRRCPVDAEHYGKLKLGDRMLVFKSVHYIDVKEIWLKQKGKPCVKFEGCYYPIHSALEK